jgi:uncharacterized protein YpmS
MIKGDCMSSTQKKWLIERLSIVSLTISLFGAQCVYAQVRASEEADPARWSQEDTTIEQQYVTARKELAAAYQISLTDCAKLTAIDRQLCVNDAKRDYEQELSLLGFRLGLTK